MKYHDLGKTGMKVSSVGLGCVQIGSSQTDHAVQIVRRALELGVNYFDTARSYLDSEIRVGIGLGNDRSKVYISSKTGAKTKEEAWQHIHESLERLQTVYLDNYHLHELRDTADVESRCGPSGALEALIEAKSKGLIRHIGCTSHLSKVLLEALDRFEFEIILVPMNIVEREPLDQLIPICRERGVGITIMKPVATGLLPATLALKWLINQPIGTAVPGATTVEEVEENSLVGHIDDPTLTKEELKEVEIHTERLENLRCRICYACEPCPVGIPISVTLGTDVTYDHYRTMGKTNFGAFPWSMERIKKEMKQRPEVIKQIEACDGCGVCEERCPYHLPIIKMLKDILPAMKDIRSVWDSKGF